MAKCTTCGNEYDKTFSIQWYTGETYTFDSFGDHATPATFNDAATGTWFMYTLNLSVQPAVISVRTYTPSNIVAPTSMQNIQDNCGVHTDCSH